MDTINLSASGHDISFSKKSVTIDGEEYLYTGISAIKHSSAKHVYLFKYEENWHPLYYNENSAKQVDALFKKIAELNSRRAKAKKDVNQEPAEAAVEEPIEAAVEKPVEAAVEEPAEVAAEEPVDVKAEDAEASTEEKSDELEAAAESDEEKSAKAAFIAERKSRLKKSIIILALIIALFIGAGIAYFFIIGPTNDSSQGPAVDETHQYKDIEQMIKDMQD